MLQLLKPSFVQAEQENKLASVQVKKQQKRGVFFNKNRVRRNQKIEICKITSEELLNKCCERPKKKTEQSGGGMGTGAGCFRRRRMFGSRLYYWKYHAFPVGHDFSVGLVGL